MPNLKIDRLPENHALYGVETRVLETEEEKGLLPSIIEFWRPPNDSGCPRTCCGWLAFQNGPIKEAGVNGIGIEHLLGLVVARLKGYQATPFKCVENELATGYIKEALSCLQARTDDRQQRGVEGMNKP